MSAHGRGTTVPIERSQERIVALLATYGAYDVQVSVSPSEVRLAWTIKAKRSSIAVPMPSSEPGRFGWEIEAKHEQGLRERWRSIEAIVRGYCESVWLNVREVVDMPRVSASPMPPPPMLETTSVVSAGVRVMRALGRARV